jgi:transposase-like protein
MTKDTTKEAAVAADHLLFDDWFDAIEDGVRARVRGFIEALLEEELAGTLSPPRYGRLKPGEDEAAPPVAGSRPGHRKRGLTGTFGRTEISVPRARLMGAYSKASEWKSASLRAYQRRTKAADALIAGAYWESGRFNSAATSSVKRAHTGPMVSSRISS